ncbi:hypothetical protein [Alicyclobacillus dauci]|uniref:Lipoprotein n=1 Tax=Alicyclobacillus dauci TaxID=1475485 RepID=A0ABY6YX78_9BACL|nr:hypothetical protein [Alicyclobacillus dauci]WAH35117.1 hypothetical protein NZD86_12380 [Alicyclobacillus dauci]
MTRFLRFLNLAAVTSLGACASSICLWIVKRVAVSHRYRLQS